MNARWRGLLHWLTPGMRVKRWVLLSVVSMAILVVGLLYVLGVDLVRIAYRTLPTAAGPRYTILAAVVVFGGGGFALALARLVRSVARSASADSRIKPSTMIYRARRLARGPRVVALGGGTGLSSLLRGLKEVTANITAVVTVMDDGGSSGRLREGIDVLPPGDVRNCILALAEDETQLSDFFQYRFTGPPELAGHALGNIVLAGLEQATGGFDRAIEAMSHFLNIRGQVLPATLASTHLVATMEDGTRIEGESQLSSDPRRIARLELSSSPVVPYDKVIDAIGDADLIVLGPGSLFTSIIPNVLVDGIADAIHRAGAEKVLIANLMTQPGETTGFTLRDHLNVLNEYVDLFRFDTILVNTARVDQSLLPGYIDEAAEPVPDDLADSNEYRLRVVRADLVGTAQWGGKQTIKHDPRKLARTLVRETRAFTAARRERAAE